MSFRYACQKSPVKEPIDTQKRPANRCIPQLKQDATLEVATLVHDRHEELAKWSRTIASHPAVNQCRRHFQTEAFLRESVDMLRKLLAALRLIEAKSDMVYGSDSLSDICRLKQKETLQKLAAFQLSPDAHESMHGMLRYGCESVSLFFHWYRARSQVSLV